MNIYKKFCANVFVAECDEQHEKGDIIDMTTKRSKVIECEVHNLVAEKNGKYYYSITRVDGYDARERARAKAERYHEWANSASRKSDEYYQNSRKNAEYLSLGEPIKVGHHSEQRHRKQIEMNWANVGKSVAMREKAEAHEEKAEHWAKKAETEMNLSMPESLEYYTQKLEEAKEYHEGVKSGKYPREHSYTLSYAKKAVNELTKKVKLAQTLWA